MMKTIEQELIQNGRSFFQTVGDSMEPLLHDRKSTVVIERKRTHLKLYDVALFRRATGEYILHRVVRVLKDGYLVCGDNRVRRERVPEEWVIGVMVGYFEDERDCYVSCEHASYQKYLRTLKIKSFGLWICNLREHLFKTCKMLLRKCRT